MKNFGLYFVLSAILLTATYSYISGSAFLESSGTSQSAESIKYNSESNTGVFKEYSADTIQMIHKKTELEKFERIRKIKYERECARRLDALILSEKQRPLFKAKVSTLSKKVLAELKKQGKTPDVNSVYNSVKSQLVDQIKTGFACGLE